MSALLFALTVLAALYVAYAQYDARQSARRAADAARVAEDAATAARHAANIGARWVG